MLLTLPINVQLDVLLTLQIKFIQFKLLLFLLNTAAIQKTIAAAAVPLIQELHGTQHLRGVLITDRG
jgi:ABC-type arginine transport system ATPase subunit